MSNAVEETLRKLERTHISEPSTGASSPSPVSTASASLPSQGFDAPPRSTKGTPEPAPPTSSAPLTATDAETGAGDEAAGRRTRRAVQSMYGAPPGYNATMGVGGGRDALGRGRVGSGRQRNSIMIPDQLQAAMHPQSIVPMTPLQAPATRLTGAEYALMANMPDDAIPNAIVVKNINFAIKREELLQTIADRGLPVPYAFNYHFEGTMFRGLAFGNFRTPEEAARVIVGLNGVSLLGRPLKVEYKKTLPGTAPPPHPNTIAMMNSSAAGMHSTPDAHSDSSYASSQHQQTRYDQPIPRPRRNQNGEPADRPRSMMTFPSALPVPELGGAQGRGHQSSLDASPGGGGDLIDLDDPDTRTLYDLVSSFRHNKSMGELEFPSGLNTRQRQIVMLVAERFGLNHETKGDAGGRYIRIYKGLETLLEGAEVRRRSMAGAGVPSMGSGSGVNSGAGNSRYGTTGRSRPASMLYPSTMSMGGLSSPPPPSQRMGFYPQQQQQQQQQQQLHGYHDPTRVRSYTHSQGANHLSSQQLQYQQPQPSQQAFSRAGDANPGRASGSYVGYPSRLYQDSVVVPARQPHGPEMSQNFAARQQMHQQDERHAQRQAQLKMLQQNRQRRLSSANEETYSAGAGLESAFTIAKPGNRAIPIVNPKDDEASVADTVSQPSNSSSHSPANGRSQNEVATTD